MKKVLFGCALILLSIMPAHAEYTPAQKIVMTMETWRLRAKDCRTRHNTFTGAEIAALTDLVISGVQFAKFESSKVSSIMKALEIYAMSGPPPTKDVCERVHTLIFGAP